jgi:hypothetical protein
MFRGIAAGGGAAARVLAAFLLAGGCLAAVAYAATDPGSGQSAASADAGFRGSAGGAGPPRGPRPPRPLITSHPRSISTAASARFAFRSPGGDPSFECRLERGAWKHCRSPLRYAGLGLGGHSFSVRAVGAAGRRGGSTRYRWQRVEAKPFAIEPQLDALGALYPGGPAQPLPVVLRNPNPVPIFVTGLRVVVTADPAGCESAANLELTPSSASVKRPVLLAPRGSASLPSADASPPAIALRDLPVNQDACQGAHFPLVFSGEAHG